MNTLLAMSTLLAMFGKGAGETDTGFDWLNTLMNTTMTLINPVLIVVAVVGIIYAIWVGIKFVKADEKNEREEAKQKLIMVIVGIVVTLILIAVFYFMAFNINSIVDSITKR